LSLPLTCPAQILTLRANRGRSSFFSGVRIEGFSLDLSWQSVEKWGWRKEEHLKRFEQAIAEAGVTRIAQAKAWMDKVESNLEKINEWKKKNTTTATAAAKENEETKGAKKALATTTELLLLLLPSGRSWLRLRFGFHMGAIQVKAATKAATPVVDSSRFDIALSLVA
jgi:hypothetical protein